MSQTNVSSPRNHDETVAVTAAREYYDSADADDYYFKVWGGEDIHVGLYESSDEAIIDASRRTVAAMASRLSRLNGQTRVLDVGAGFGGPARFLAKTYGCHVVTLNVSEVENRRSRQMNRHQGLTHLIDVVDGNFEAIPEPDESFDVVWSQDAILHSGHRERALEEIARVLKVGAEFVFTDPMQADDCPDGVLQPILDRIHLETLGSPAFYRDTADRVGLEQIAFEDLSGQLVTHYGRVLQETERRQRELTGSIGEEYIERMKKGLSHWIDGGRNGYLVWGILQFRKVSQQSKTHTVPVG